MVRVSSSEACTSDSDSSDAAAVDAGACLSSHASLIDRLVILRAASLEAASPTSKRLEPASPSGELPLARTHRRWAPPPPSSRRPTITAPTRGRRLGLVDPGLLHGDGVGTAAADTAAADTVSKRRKRGGRKHWGPARYGCSPPTAPDPSAVPKSAPVPPWRQKAQTAPLAKTMPRVRGGKKIKRRHASQKLNDDTATGSAVIAAQSGSAVVAARAPAELSDPNPSSAKTRPPRRDTRSGAQRRKQKRCAEAQASLTPFASP